MVPESPLFRLCGCWAFRCISFKQSFGRFPYDLIYAVVSVLRYIQWRSSFYRLLRYVNIIHLNILSLTILAPSRWKCMSHIIDIIFLLRCSNRHGIQYSRFIKFQSIETHSHWLWSLKIQGPWRLAMHVVIYTHWRVSSSRAFGIKISAYKHSIFLVVYFLFDRLFVYSFLFREPPKQNTILTIFIMQNSIFHFQWRCIMVSQLKVTLRRWRKKHSRQFGMFSLWLISQSVRCLFCN